MVTVLPSWIIFLCNIFPLPVILCFLVDTGFYIYLGYPGAVGNSTQLKFLSLKILIISRISTNFNPCVLMHLLIYGELLLIVYIINQFISPTDYKILASNFHDISIFHVLNSPWKI